MSTLVPLRVPNGWAVIINHFGDEDPVLLDGAIVNDLYYSEDLLSVQSLRYEDGAWVTDEDGHILDLGWYPESDPDGRYRLVVMRRDWNNVLVEIESTDRQEIRSTIERCLELITEGVDDQAIAQRMKAD